MPLSQTQKRHLRGLAHALNPVILVGQKGVTDALLAEFAIALDHHELVKVKLGGAERDERNAMIAALGEGSGAELVQTIGHVASFWRRNPQAPKIALPR